MRIPRAGEIVLYCTPWGAIRPAIVILVEEAGTLSLSVLTDGRRDSRWTFAHPMWQPDVPYSETPEPGTWFSNAPERR